MNVMQSKPYGRETTLRGPATDRGRGEKKYCLIASGLRPRRYNCGRLLTPAAGTPQDCRTDQNTDAERYADGDQRAVFGFAGDPLQGVAAILGAEVERLIAEAPGLIARSLPTFPKAVHHLAQDRGDGVADLIARRSDGLGRLAPAHSTNLFQFLHDSAQMFLDSRNAWGEI